MLANVICVESTAGGVVVLQDRRGVSLNYVGEAGRVGQQEAAVRCALQVSCVCRRAPGLRFHVDWRRHV
eukprot:8044783-Lingulodinium_polyedra.AAC.1